MNLPLLDDIINLLLIVSFALVLIFELIYINNTDEDFEEVIAFIEGALIGVVYSILFSGFFFGYYDYLTRKMGSRKYYFGVLVFNILYLISFMSLSIYNTIKYIEDKKENRDSKKRQFLITFGFTANISIIYIIVYLAFNKPSALISKNM